MAFRILLTECTSPLGAALQKTFESVSYSLVCPAADHVDWGEPDSVAALFEDCRPSIVINVLAWSQGVSPERMERQHHVLAETCRIYDLALIHLSSHEVFSSDIQEGPVDEQQAPNPTSAEGLCFLRFEQHAARVKRHILLRLTWLVDLPGGMLEDACRRLVNEKEVCVTENWRGCPLPMAEVGRVVLAMVHQILCGAENWGVFHLHTSDSCSEAEFADLVARFLQKMQRPTAPIVVVGQQQRWIRSNGWLAGTRCTNKFGIQLRSWRQGIKTKIQAWADDQTAAGSADMFAPVSAPGADTRQT